jgi:putative flippase GtrA
VRSGASAVSRILRYLVVGTIAFAIDLGLLLVLAPLVPLLAANTLAFIVANAANFVLGHAWVFGRSLRDPDLARHYTAVLVVSVVGLAINDLVVWAGVVVAGAGLIVPKVAATAVALAWNFAARARWIYRDGAKTAKMPPA